MVVLLLRRLLLLLLPNVVVVRANALVTAECFAQLVVSFQNARIVFLHVVPELCTVPGEKVFQVV